MPKIAVAVGQALSAIAATTMVGLVVGFIGAERLSASTNPDYPTPADIGYECGFVDGAVTNGPLVYYSPVPECEALRETAAKHDFFNPVEMRRFQRAACDPQNLRGCSDY